MTLAIVLGYDGHASPQHKSASHFLIEHLKK
jgi:hypothetical protein